MGPLLRAILGAVFAARADSVGGERDEAPEAVVGIVQTVQEVCVVAITVDVQMAADYSLCPSVPPLTTTITYHLVWH